MKKKDLFIAAIVILFGLTYQYFENGDIKFMDGCSTGTHYLKDKDFPNYFKLKEKKLNGIESVVINNPAGNINITENKNGKTSIEIAANIYSKSTTFAKKISKEISAAIEKKEKTLYVKTGNRSEFPYSRVRITIDLNLRGGSNIKLKNRYGNISVSVPTDNLIIDQHYGDVKIVQPVKTFDLNCKYSKVKIKEVKKNSNLEAKYSYIELTNSGSIKSNSTYSEFYIKNINTTEDITLINRSSKISLIKVNTSNLNIKNSNGRIYLEDIKADTSRILSKNCRINIYGMISEDTILKNSYEDMNIKNIKGDSINLDVKNLNMNLHLGERLNSVNITANYSDIDLILDKGINPFFDISSTYGEIINKTDLSFLTTKEKHLIRLSGGGRTPQIIIFSKYSDIKLKNI